MKIPTVEWIKSAHDDLLVADEIIGNEALAHMVAFHSQQCIEKAFKAALEEIEGSVPKIHALETLLPRVLKHVALPASLNLDLLEELDKLYLDARYPGTLGLLPNGKPSRSDAERFKHLADHILSKIEKFLLKGAGSNAP